MSAMFLPKIMDDPRPSITIIGAGVIGLTCALHLQSIFPKTYQILLVARDFPIEESIHYTSMWAGAHIRPVPGTSKQLTQEAEWLEYTYKALQKQIVEEPWSGITKVEGVEFMEEPGREYVQEGLQGRYFRNMPGFRELRREELPGGVKFGVRYETFCINSPVYCSSLLRKFRLNGGKLVRKTLSSERGAFTLAKDVRCVVNASGMGFGDNECFPTRGQTVLIANPCPFTVTKQNADGTWNFIIPRGFDGGTVIGGTKEPNDWNAEPSLQVRGELLQAAAKLYPAILNDTGGFDVVADVVGRRPTRRGGMRVEVEIVGEDRAKVMPIVHAYGAGGRGFEISKGVARDVGALVQGHLEGKTKARL